MYRHRDKLCHHDGEADHLLRELNSSGFGEIAVGKATAGGVFIVGFL